MGGSSTTTVQAPPPTDQEIELLQQEVKLAEQQLIQLEQFGVFQEAQFEATLPLIQQQADVQQQALELQQQQFEAMQPFIGQQAALQQQLLNLQREQFTAAQPLIQQQADVQAQQLAFQQQQLGLQQGILPLQSQLLQAQLEDQLARSAAGGTAEERAERARALQDLEFQQIQTQLAGAQQAQRLLPLQEQLATAQVEALQRAVEGPTPEQLSQLEAMGQAQFAAGEVDISRFETQGLEALREELAPSLGLSSRDTPILDRGARIAAEATRQRGQLSSNIRLAQLTAGQNLPLAQAQILGGVGAQQQQLSAQAERFQAGLAQQAAVNRMQLAGGMGGAIGGVGAGGGMVPQTGLGLASVGQTLAGIPQLPGIGQTIAGTNQAGLGLLAANRAAPGQTALGLGGQRIAQASRTTTQDPGLLDIMGAAGGMMVGAGMMMTSDVRLKSEITEPEAVWDETVALSQYVREYDMFGTRQTGLIAQDIEERWPELVSEQDGIKGIYYHSVFVKALKALGEAMRRIETLEAAAV